MSAFDLLLSPSHAEAFPNVVGEAMSCGIPCVVTDVGDCKNIIQNKKMVVKKNDMDGMADKIYNFCHLDSNQKDLIKKKLRKRISARFNILKIVNEIELYTEIYMKRSKKFSIKNLDDSTIEHFGNEWKEFTQNEKEFKNQSAIFNDYFSVFDWKLISKKSIVMDVGSGSGRWAKFVANKVKHLILFDASFDALTVSKYNLSNINNVSFVNGSVDHIPVKNNSLDFVYSLGVLHHVPSTKSAILEISKN